MSNYIQDLVSVIIPTYKRSDSLLRAINSVLSQTYKKIEIIVVDDNEPNDKFSLVVQEKLSSINDNRLRYIQQERHINGAAARNAGIKVARGEFIAFLDDDDEWLPNKLKSQLSILKNNSLYDAISCLYSYYQNGELIRKGPNYTNENLHRKVLERSVSILTPTVLFRRTALDRSGYFDETFTRHQDLQLFLDFLINHKMQVLPEYHVKIHVDIGGNRPNARKMIEVKQHFFKKMKRHFDSYDKKVQGRIYAGHYFEIIFLLLKERKIALIFKYIIKIGLRPAAYYDLLKRISKRKN